MCVRCQFSIAHPHSLQTLHHYPSPGLLRHPLSSTGSLGARIEKYQRSTKLLSIRQRYETQKSGAMEATPAGVHEGATRAGACLLQRRCRRLGEQQSEAPVMQVRQLSKRLLLRSVILARPRGSHGCLASNSGGYS